MNNTGLSAGWTRRLASGLGAACALAGLWLAAAGAQAQPLPAQAAPAAPGLGVPMGKGAGVHGANSPFAPLPARADVVPWPVLTAVKVKNEKNRIVPVFTLTQMALNQTTQRIQGFMMPLEPGATQRHFLLSSVPLTCGFCLPGGPESMVEVKSRTPVKYSTEPVVVQGRFQVLHDDAFGMYYRITEAAGVN
jgi:hypothetical protein